MSSTAAARPCWCRASCRAPPAKRAPRASSATIGVFPSRAAGRGTRPGGPDVTPHPRELFARAAHHASRFRDSLAERPPRPTIPAKDLQALFDGPTPETGEDPLAVIDALAA